MTRKGITIEQAKKQMHEKALKAMKESVLMVEADAKLLVGVNISAPYYGDIV